MSHVHLRILGPHDAADFQRLRLQGLREAPEAFGTTYEEDRVLPEEVVAERLRPVRVPAGRAVVGAFRRLTLSVVERAIPVRAAARPEVSNCQLT